MRKTFKIEQVYCRACEFHEKLENKLNDLQEKSRGKFNIESINITHGEGSSAYHRAIIIYSLEKYGVYNA